MIFNLIFFVLTAAIWLAALWFGRPVDLHQMAPHWLLGLAILPPLMLTLMVAWVRRRRARQKAEAEAGRQAEEEAKRAAAKAVAQAEHDEKMRQRRFACDCRAIAVTGLIAHGPQAEDLPAEPGLYWAAGDADQAREAADTLDGLSEYLEEALTAVYETSPAAAWLPHWVCPPADVAGDEFVQALQQAAHRAAKQLVGDDAPERIQIRYLPESSHTSERLLGLFESDPGLPGAVVVGLDSPLIRQAGDDEFDEVPDPAELERVRWHGAPGQSVAVLLLTAQSLAARAAELTAAPAANAGDTYTPYWEKSVAGGESGWLQRIPATYRPTLVTAPVLATLHRGAVRQSEKELRSLELAGFCQAVIDRALVNAGLRDLPFGEAAPKEAVPLSEHCRWLVHHAGGIERGGTRLAALGNALSYFAIDLDPVEEATNTVVHFGDVGRALPVLLAAMTLSRAATQGGAFCAEFVSGREFAGYLARAPQST